LAGSLPYGCEATLTHQAQSQKERKIAVKSNLELVKQVLKSKMKESTAATRLRDSIRIHQVADPIDMTQEAAEREMAIENLDRETALIRRIRGAMERIEHSSYGVCLECEEPISPKRLKAIPWAERCIICQEWADHAGANSKMEIVTNFQANAA
jgi:DnaK suppressor protein